MGSEWQQWEEVTVYVASGHTLYRSSAPNYDGIVDSTQKLTATAVKYLTDKGIDSIISFNEFSYKSAEWQLLVSANISYLHLSVVDGHAPTLEQLESAIAFFKTKTSTLVHCGYGHGRTGTGVTALQLSGTKGLNPVQDQWMTVNHVETATQVAVLERLKAELINSDLK